LGGEYLVKSGKFSLPGKAALYGDDTEVEVVLVDVTESSGTSEKDQKRYYSGKK